MPDVRELGRRVKAKYPGKYDDLADDDVGRRVKARYPGAYDDFADTPAAQPPGTLGNVGIGAGRAGLSLSDAALAIAETVQGMKRGDVAPLLENLELAGRGALSTVGYLTAGAPADPKIAEIKRRQAERRSRSDLGHGFEMLSGAQQALDVRAGQDPSITGKIVRRGTEGLLTAAPAVATGVATGGSIPAMAAVSALQSAGQPEAAIPSAVAGALPLPVGQAVKAGIGAVRRTLGKGAAQIIEAEVAPAVTAPVRPAVAPEVPPVIGEAVPTPYSPLPTPTVDPLQSAVAKLGTDDLDQIGAMIANANRRFGKKRTPAELQSSRADYEALRQLTPDENKALGQVLPARNVSPVVPDYGGKGAYSRDIQNIPMSEFENDPQLAANLRHAMEFFDAQGRPPSAIAEQMTSMARTPTSPVLIGDLRQRFPGIPRQQFDDEVLRLAEEGQIALHRHDYPGSLSAVERENMVKVGNDYYTAATSRTPSATGPSISPPSAPFSLDPPSMVPAGVGGGMPPLPPGGVPTGFGGSAPGPQQPLIEFAPSVSLSRQVLQRAKDEFFGLLGASKSLRSSIDISAPFRQGALLMLPPTKWRHLGKTWGNMFRAFKSKDLEAIKQGIDYHPELKRMEDAGLFLANRTRQGLNQGEEAFLRRSGSKISEAVSNLPGVKQSNQMYTAFLDTQRIENFMQYKRLADKAGLSTAETEKAYKAAAEWVNITSGRGSLGQRLDKALEGLNFFFFSPRFVASRLNVLNPAMYLRNLSSPGGRVILKEQMKELAQFAGVVAGTLYLAKSAGADVNTDVESPDFAKIKIGRHRFDMGAGLTQLMRMYYRLGKDFARAGRGEEAKFGKTAIDVGETFLSYKLSPPAAVFRNFINQRSPDKKPFTAGRAIADLAAPMQWADFVDAWLQEGFGGAAMTLPGTVGIGSQLYGVDPVNEAIESKRPLFAELQRLDRQIAPLKRRTGEPDDIFNPRVQQFAQNFSAYGLQLIDSPRFRMAPDDVKSRALNELNERAKRLTLNEMAYPELELDAELIMDMVETGLEREAETRRERGW